MRKTVSPSWVLVSRLKTHNNLFLQDEQASEYLVRAYTCKCGHDDLSNRGKLKKVKQF